MPVDYLQKILTAKVYDVAVETPLELAADAVAAPRQSRVAEARGSAVGVFVQAARRLQQDGAHERGRARAGRHRGVGRQSCAGRGARRAAARLRRDDRDAGHDAADQDRGSRGTRGDRRAARRFVLGRVREGAGAAEGNARDVRASVRRSGRHCGPGHDRHGNPAPVPGTARCDFRRDRRRRADQRGRGVRETRASRGADHRRAAGRLRCNGALDRGGAAGHAAARRTLRRRRGREAGRQGNVSPCAEVRRRHRHRRHGRDLRGAEGRVRGHALDPRARRRACDCRRQGLGRANAGQGSRRSRRSPAART